VIPSGSYQGISCEKRKNPFFCLPDRLKTDKSVFIMSTLIQLSRREREVLEILFSLGEATLGEVAERMADAPTRPALRSIVTILMDKGHVGTAGKRGREYVYRPLRQPMGEGTAAWRRVVTTFFGGSVKAGLAAYLADPEAAVSSEELREIESLIRAARRRANPK